MSKVLFSADWHIKLGQKNVPRAFQINRFRDFFLRAHEYEKEVDYHIIGGDIFDRTPTMEELALFFEYVKGVTTPVYVYDGNHEAHKKGKTWFVELAKMIQNPNIHVILGCGTINNEIDIIPYTDLKTFNTKDFSNNILATHVRGEIPPHVKPEIDLDRFDQWQVVLAGDLHSYSNCQRNILYPGSPMSTTFHRTTTKTGMIVLDTNTLEHEWVSLKLPQLIRKSVENEDDMIKTEFDHTIYELVGDVKKLSSVKTTNELLDKKVVTRQVDATLDFSNTTSVVEELVLYLTKVQGLEDTDNIVKVHNDNISET